MAYSRQVSELIELDTVGFLEGTVKWRKHDKLLPDEIDARRAAAPRPLGKCVCVRLAALRGAAGRIRAARNRKGGCADSESASRIQPKTSGVSLESWPMCHIGPMVAPLVQPASLRASPLPSSLRRSFYSLGNPPPPPLPPARPNPPPEPTARTHAHATLTHRRAKYFNAA
jgi:hypothetical protein